MNFGLMTFQHLFILALIWSVTLRDEGTFLVTCGSNVSTHPNEFALVQAPYGEDPAGTAADEEHDNSDGSCPEKDSLPGENETPILELESDLAEEILSPTDRTIDLGCAGPSLAHENDLALSVPLISLCALHRLRI